MNKTPKSKYARLDLRLTPKEYLDEDLFAALRYVKNDSKTDRQVFVGGVICSKENRMLDHRKKYMYVQGHLVTISFSEQKKCSLPSKEFLNPKSLHRGIKKK